MTSSEEPCCNLAVISRLVASNPWFVIESDFKSRVGTEYMMSLNILWSSFFYITVLIDKNKRKGIVVQNRSGPKSMFIIHPLVTIPHSM